MSFFEIKPGFILYSEDDSSDSFYIIKEGVMKSLSGGREKLLTSGDTFGELCLIDKHKLRSETVQCQEKARIFALDREVFYETILKHNQNNLKERFFFLSLIPIFSKL